MLNTNNIFSTNIINVNVSEDVWRFFTLSQKKKLNDSDQIWDIFKSQARKSNTKGTFIVLKIILRFTAVASRAIGECLYKVSFNVFFFFISGKLVA